MADNRKNDSAHVSKALHINRMYALRHGYKFYHDQMTWCKPSKTVASGGTELCKPKAILQAMWNMNENDTMIYLDSDAFFTNFDITLAWFLSNTEIDMRQTWMVLPSDCWKSPLNTGIIIARPWAVSYLKLWQTETQSIKSWSWDQLGFNRALRKSAGMRMRIKIIASGDLWGFGTCPADANIKRPRVRMKDRVK